MFVHCSLFVPESRYLKDASANTFESTIHSGEIMKLTKTFAAIALSAALATSASLPALAYPTSTGAAGEVSVQVKTSNGVKSMVVAGTTSSKLAGSTVKVTAVLKGVTINLGTVRTDSAGNFTIKSSKTTKPGVYKVTVAGTGAKAGTKTVITITVK